MARYHETPTRAAANKACDNSQKYSLYLEVNTKTRRKQSVSKNGEKTQKERDNMRASLDPATGRRRVTMRSKEHDDEEEQIQRAIEESKREVGTTGNTRRIGKRSREESEECVLLYRK